MHVEYCIYIVESIGSILAEYFLLMEQTESGSFFLTFFLSNDSYLVQFNKFNSPNLGEISKTICLIFSHSVKTVDKDFINSTTLK